MSQRYLTACNPVTMHLKVFCYVVSLGSYLLHCCIYTNMIVLQQLCVVTVTLTVTCTFLFLHVNQSSSTFIRHKLRRLFTEQEPLICVTCDCAH